MDEPAQGLESAGTAGVPARVSLVTLGASDVARSTAFYAALGWRLSAASVEGDVSFFRTAGAVLSIYGADALAADARQDAPPGGGFRGMALAINVATREDVDAALATALAAGGTILKRAEVAFWGGYSGYFADPDGHAWEVAHNPGFPLDADDLPVLP
jgi:hypothetical protein